MALKLSIYDIIKGPVVTDKVQGLYRKFKTIVLNVHPKANKPQVKEALEKLFNVKTKSIRIIIRKGKFKRPRMSRIRIQDPLKKRALITLAEGYSLDLLTQGGTASPEVAASNETSDGAKV